MDDRPPIRSISKSGPCAHFPVKRYYVLYTTAPREQASREINDNIQLMTNGWQVIAGRAGYFIIIISLTVRVWTACYFIVYVNSAETLILYSINKHIYIHYTYSKPWFPKRISAVHKIIISTAIIVIFLSFAYYVLQYLYEWKIKYKVSVVIGFHKFYLHLTFFFVSWYKTRKNKVLNVFKYVTFISW